MDRNLISIREGKRKTKERRTYLLVNGVIRQYSYDYKLNIPYDITTLLIAIYRDIDYWKEKIKNIYTPRPEESNSDIEWPIEQSPSWHRLWDPHELLNRYEPIRELGRGAYSLHYEGKVLKKWGELETGKKVAIKQKRRIFHTDTDAKRFLREVRILTIFKNHNHIVSLYDIIPPKAPRTFQRLTLVFQFVDADLAKIFRTNQFFTTVQVQYILYQILLGIKYMHSANIVHRNLKPENILINENCIVQICDFGLSICVDEYLNQSQHISTGHTVNKQSNDGETDKDAKKRKRRKLFKKKKKPLSRRRWRQETQWYKAPETFLLQQKQKTLLAVDMWSVGAIFGELLQMQRENRSDPTKRGPMFPGDSCFGLSIQDQMDYGMDCRSRIDQMQVMFDVIGSPTELEIQKITDEKARKYLNSLPQHKKRNLRRIFPGTCKDGRKLFTQLCTFDVDVRITVNEALEHSYFKYVREPVHERARRPVSRLVELSQLSQKQWRELILEEVLKYNKYDMQRFVQSGAMPNYKKMKEKEAKQMRNKADIIIHGYVRKNNIISLDH